MTPLSRSPSSCSSSQSPTGVTGTGSSDDGVFGHLRVGAPCGRGPQGHVLYDCVCECGRHVSLTRLQLLRRKYLSCGQCGIDRQDRATHLPADEIMRLGADYISECRKPGKRKEHNG